MEELRLERRTISYVAVAWLHNVWLQMVNRTQTISYGQVTWSNIKHAWNSRSIHYVARTDHGVG